MPNQEPSVDRTFAALSDPTRRAVVQALSRRSATVSELARPFAMALPSFTQHLGVLEDAGVVRPERKGRTRICSLNPEALSDAEDWMASHRRRWEARLDRLEAHLDRTEKEGSDD